MDWRNLYGDKSMSPDDLKRYQSGFWSHEYRIENNETVWRCDLRGLEEAVRHVVMDYHEARLFMENPVQYLDRRFGEGTGYAYARRHEGDRPYIDLRTPRHMAMDLARDRDMAMAYGYTTATNTTTTSGTSGNYWMVDEMTKVKKRKAHSPIRFKKKLVRNLPFVDGGDGLVNTLQREFDHWAGDQMKVLYG